MGSELALSARGGNFSLLLTWRVRGRVPWADLAKRRMIAGSRGIDVLIMDGGRDGY